MTQLFSRVVLILSLFILFGCSSIPTRENNPEQFDLIASGQIPTVAVLNFKNCLVAGFEVKNRLAYNIATQEKTSANGYKVESYGGEKYLLLSADILYSGKTQLLRLKNSSLSDLSKQISTYDSCLAKHK